MIFIKPLESSDSEKEKKYKKKEKKERIKSIVEKILWFILVLLSLISVFYLFSKIDVILVGTIKKLDIKYNTNYFEIVNNLFAIQATLATLTIAFISIFSGIIKDKVYGFPITKYILKIKNGKFNIYNLSILLLMLTIYFFAFLVNTSYIVCCMIFIFSILIILHILKTCFYLMSEYEEIEDKLFVYINKLICSSKKLCYKKSKEKELRYILEEKYKIKKQYKRMESAICELHNDTIEKINDKDFNNYVKNLKLLKYCLIDYDYLDMNAVQKDILLTLIQRVNSIIYTLIENKNFSLAYEFIFIINEKSQFGVQQEISDNTKNDILKFFDSYYYIEELANCINNNIIYDFSMVEILGNLIFNYQYYQILYIEMHILNECYNSEEFFNKIMNLFIKYYEAIKNNKNFTGKQKQEALDSLKKYHNEYQKQNSKWGHYLNYDMYLFLKEGIGKDKIKIDKETILYKKMDNELNNIKKKIDNKLCDLFKM